MRAFRFLALPLLVVVPVVWSQAQTDNQKTPPAASQPTPAARPSTTVPPAATTPPTPRRQAVSELRDALTKEEWDRVDRSVDKALAWLAKQQENDGRFPTLEQAQPGVTSLCVLAFLSAGHQPGEGQYGDVINRAIDYVLKCQDTDGMFAVVAPEAVPVVRGPSHTAAYNHAITSLMLCEVYGQVSRERTTKVDLAIRLALAVTTRMQTEPAKIDPRDKGGWRYYHARRAGARSDLSVTGWQMKFLRSAKNAQFEVPDKMIEEGVKYVESVFQPDRGEFFYGHVIGEERYTTRGLMGAGILTLALAGKHDTEMARKAGDWILARPFNAYLQIGHLFDRFHYSAYYCSNAMAQLGGDYWKKFFPVLSKCLLDAQSEAGPWNAESGLDANFGPCYPTAMSVLSLTPAYQLLPIYQR